MEQSNEYTEKPQSLGSPSGRPRKSRRQSVDVACVRCRERKIRCDGASPCSPCKQRNVPCREPENRRAPSRSSLEQRVAKLEALAASSFEKDFIHSNQERLTPLSSPAPQLSTPEPQSRWSNQPSLGLQIPSSTSLKPPPIEVYSPPDDGGLGSSLQWTIPTIDVTPSSRPHSPFTPSSTGPEQRPLTPSSASSTESWSVPHSPAPSLLWPLEDSENGADARPVFDISLLMGDHLGPSRRSSLQTSHRQSSHSNSVKEGNAPITDAAWASGYSAEPCNMVDQSSQLATSSIDEILRSSANSLAVKPIESLSSSSSATRWPAAYGAQIMADRNHADACASAYFNDVHPLYPFLDETTFFSLLDAIYKDGSQATLPVDITPTIATFQVYMVLAIGALVLKNQRGDSRVARDTYYLAAIRQMDALQMWNSISGIQCALLLALVCLYDGTLSHEAWALKSNIVSACVDLELHKRPQSVPMSSWDILRIRVFLSAYYLDRNIGFGLDRPFSIAEEEADLESFLNLLRDTQGQGIISYPDCSLLAVLTGVYEVNSSTRRMQQLLGKSSASGSSASLLCDPTPTTVMNWRSQTFQKLEFLRAEFVQIVQASGVHDNGGKMNSRGAGTLVETTELKIQEAVLSLFHPSEQAIYPLTQPEIDNAISTARLSLVTYKRRWVSRKLFICTTTARSVYMCGEALALLCAANGGEENSLQPELGFCFDILRDFTEIEAARELLEKLRRLVG